MFAVSPTDDNPYSEAQFKTLKYRRDSPDRFGSIEDARLHCDTVFPLYNTEHRHSRIALMSPTTVHHGLASQLTRRRAATLDAAFHAHPERFKNNALRPPKLPNAGWINPTMKKATSPIEPSTPAL